MTPLHIGNDLISLTLALPARGMPQIISFGPHPPSAETFPMVDRARRINGMDVSVPCALLLPTGGFGFFGWPAFAGHRDGRDFAVDFSHWAATPSPGRVTLQANDAVAELELTIMIDVFDTGVIAMSTELTNTGYLPLTVDRLMAGSILVAEPAAILTTFGGMWGREMHRAGQVLGRGLWLQESRRGRTSHDRFPGIFVETQEVTYGVHLGWSGNHILAIDVLDDGRRLVHGGELFEPGEIRLRPGERYASPTLFATVVQGGRNQAATRFRDFVSRSLIRFPAPAKPRPVTLNTWEGTYFGHDLEALMDQATEAARLGVERFVLDDGWFGSRNDDTSSLGDWDVDKSKYPQGLKPLADHVVGLGMEFGLWFEPEMVSPRSALYDANPEWALQIAGRPLLTSRNQLVLDVSRSEVADYLFEKIDLILAANPIRYIKWDMNRDLVAVGGEDGRAATARQTRSVYQLIDRLRAKHPMIEIESCASGGGRMDYGILARTHRFWTSDGTDALERLATQHGASHFFPPHILGAHISARPNHQTGRHHQLAFRAIVALAYHLGIELNPLDLTSEDAKELASWISLHKRLRRTLHSEGRPFHLDPVDGRYIWGVASFERVVLFIAQASQMLAEQPPPVRVALPVMAAGIWRISRAHPANAAFIQCSQSQKDLLAGKIGFGRDFLSRAGLPLPMLYPETGIILELEHTEE